jgi:hypothetical protein
MNITYLMMPPMPAKSEDRARLDNPSDPNPCISEQIIVI